MLSYWMAAVISIGQEIVAASIYCRFWLPNTPQWCWAALFSILLVFFNSWNVRSFGEFEYWFSFIKVLTIVLFIVGGVVPCSWAFRPSIARNRKLFPLRRFFADGMAGTVVFDSICSDFLFRDRAHLDHRRRSQKSREIDPASFALNSVAAHSFLRGGGGNLTCDRSMERRRRKSKPLRFRLSVRRCSGCAELYEFCRAHGSTLRSQCIALRCHANSLWTRQDEAGPARFSPEFQEKEFPCRRC